jgi:hypothetical protein
MYKVTKLALFGASIALSTLLVRVFFQVIPSQDPDLIFQTGMLASLNQLPGALNWTVPTPIDTPFMTFKVWNVD